MLLIIERQKVFNKNGGIIDYTGTEPQIIKQRYGVANRQRGWWQEKIAIFIFGYW